MKNFKAIRITPLDGESKADAVARTVKQLISDLEAGKEPESLESVSLEDLAKESNGDDCDCPVCQVRRKLKGFLGDLGKNQQSGAIKNPSVVESAMNLMSEVEDIPNDNIMEHLLDQDNTTYNFSQALEAMRNEYRVIRGSWPAVMSLAYLNEKPNNSSEDYETADWHIAQFHNEVGKPQDPYYIAPYQFSQEDILATDWRILKYKI